MPSLNGRKIDAMWRKFGGGPRDTQCRTCEHCVKYSPTDRHYWKCRLYGVTGGESTDWRLYWPACGMYNREPVEDVPVIEQLKHLPRAWITRQEIEGQMTMEEAINGATE